MILPKDLSVTYSRLQGLLRVARQGHDRIVELATLRELAALARDSSDVVGAERWFQEALVCAIALKRGDLQAELLCELGALEASRGHAEAAVTHYKCVLERTPESDATFVRGEAILGIGTLLLKDRQPVVARAWLEEALAFFLQRQALVGQVRTRLQLAELYFASANLDAAENEARKALLLAVDAGAPELAIAARLQLGSWIALRSSGLGMGLIVDALAESQQQGNAERERDCHAALAKAHQHDQAWEEATKALMAVIVCDSALQKRRDERTQAYFDALRALEPMAVKRAQQRGAKVAHYDVANSHDLLHALLLDAALVGGSYAVALVDIDHFKQIRTEFGSAVAERVLLRATELMVESLRSGDTLARHEGEEFVAALPGASPRQARTIAERLRQAVLHADWAAVQPGLSVTLSIGVCIGSSGVDPEAVFQAADRSLEEAKSAGHNRVEVSRAA